MTGIVALYIFMLAAFTGYEVIARVPVILHTPLMSGSNFVHGIVLVGAEGNGRRHGAGAFDQGLLDRRGNRVRGRLGAQIGVATNLSDAAVHVLDQVEGTSRRTQTFLTFGVFQKNVARL